MNTFDDFWRDYPRKVSRKDAMRAWQKAIKVELPAVIISGLQRQLPYLYSRPVEFRPHAATWLNGWRWEDEVQAPSAPPKRERTILDVIDERLDRANADIFDAFRTIDAEPSRREPSPPDLRLVADASRH